MASHVIQSLLENDLYKFSMGQAVLHNYPRTSVKVEFKLRSPNIHLGYLKERIDEELDHLCTLQFTRDEVDYIRSIRYLSSDYADYLKNFRLDREQVHTEVDANGDLQMWAEGPWRDVIYFEIPCLAIVQELYMQDKPVDFAQSDQRLQEKITRFGDAAHLGFNLSDFGIRRRYSREWQDHVVAEFARRIPRTFAGTSNVYLARKYDLIPIGTFAHEWFMGIMGENVRLADVQKVALDTWAREYRGELGIALSDIFGFRAFLRDFDKYFAKLFDGCRHDSGSPFTWGNMLIEHYHRLGIDPRTKTAVFSDSLDPDLALRLAAEFCGKIKVSFGIGTNLTNDMLDHDGKSIPPLSMVMKLVESNGTPVLKLSDALGKSMCHDQSLVEYCKKVYQYKSIDEE